MVGVGIGYATMAFALPERRPDWKAVLTFPLAPVDSRCGYLIPIERGRWLASITELQCPQPPADLGSFLEAARCLRTRTIHDAIRNATPIGVPQRFVLTESSWRHYEAVPDFPARSDPGGRLLLPVQSDLWSGDERGGEAGLDPGQPPRTTCGRWRGLKGLAGEYFSEAEPWIAGAWSISATPDLAYPQTHGERPADLEHRMAFVRALISLAARDLRFTGFWSVRYIAQPGSALAEPTLMTRVTAEMQEPGSERKPNT